MIKNKRKKKKQLKDYGIQVRNKIQNNTGVSEKWKKETTRAILRHFCINRRDHEKLIWVGNRLQSDLRKSRHKSLKTDTSACDLFQKRTVCQSCSGLKL